ncbi:hypothetical protein Ga0466249_001100 [Sporomusaceae bacterium BoRhaA]|uniref:hypothetical protein n=1 Tax=Pelorhabdus rhamnosifermentans TaxID=2772457 RepID=UPI001C062453|nr:hypothetical protein [Pelorhabdus rhamnosifermentans]MBU2700008.1 hypothetical protein [Pelorhabdus rhamnosifermentans]
MDTFSLNMNTHELLKEAEHSTLGHPSASIAGNITALFAMLVLRDILAYEAATDPIANLTNIISISNSIAYLNGSIKTIGPKK